MTTATATAELTTAQKKERILSVLLAGSSVYTDKVSDWVRYAAAKHINDLYLLVVEKERDQFFLNEVGILLSTSGNLGEGSVIDAIVLFDGFLPKSFRMDGKRIMPILGGLYQYPEYERCMVSEESSERADQYRALLRYITALSNYGSERHWDEMPFGNTQLKLIKDDEKRELIMDNHERIEELIKVVVERDSSDIDFLREYFHVESAPVLREGAL